MDRLKGKVIIVAGAGGIGNELARRYAGEGAATVIGDLDARTAKAVAEEITAAGGQAVGVALDGADEGQVKSIVDLAVQKFGGLDGFHANFASFRDGESQEDILGLPMDIYDDVMRVNARGFVLCTRHALPAMLKRGAGSMVYTSSGSAYMGEPVRLAYAMSKAGVNALMRHVARRFGPNHIRANVISPGVVSHERFEKVIPQALAEQMKAAIPLGRLGAPTDIAAMGALLMSDEGSFITGQVISVDGGNSMRQ